MSVRWRLSDPKHHHDALFKKTFSVVSMPQRNFALVCPRRSSRA